MRSLPRSQINLSAALRDRVKQLLLVRAHRQLMHEQLERRSISESDRGKRVRVCERRRGTRVGTCVAGIRHVDGQHEALALHQADRILQRDLALDEGDRRLSLVGTRYAHDAARHGLHANRPRRRLSSGNAGRCEKQTLVHSRMLREEARENFMWIAE